MNRPLVLAHRGASHITPENTLAAFRAAKTMGCDGIETDVQLTRDGKLVMHHNYTIDAASDGSGAIISMTEEELRQFDFGSWKDPKFAGEKIPTLTECLEVCRGFRVVNIELKAPADRSIPYVATVARAIEESGMAGEIIVSSFDHSLLREMKGYLPQLRVGALTMPPIHYIPTFTQFSDCFPAGVPLDQLCREDLKYPEEIPGDDGGLGISEEDFFRTMLEFARSLSAIFPGTDFAGAKAALERQEDLDAYVSTLDFPLEYLHCEYRSCLDDPELIEKMHRRGIGVNPWTVDREEDMDILIAQGADGIITNRPDLLLPKLGREVG